MRVFSRNETKSTNTQLQGGYLKNARRASSRVNERVHAGTFSACCLLICTIRDISGTPVHLTKYNLTDEREADVPQLATTLNPLPPCDSTPLHALETRPLIT